MDHLSVLARCQDDFLASIPLVDPATPVPWCGSWRVSNLVVHLARIHHWAAGQARRQQETPLGRGPFDLVSLYRDCAAELLDTLHSLDPDARAWTLLDDGVPAAERTGTVRFWHRRQALETLVHTWDLRTAGGLPYDPEPSIWLDCLAEVIEVMHPRQLRLGRVPEPACAVRFRAVDLAAQLDLQSPAERPQVVVTGTAKDLALLAWGRLAASDPELAVEGDPDLLRQVLAAGLTP